MSWPRCASSSERRARFLPSSDDPHLILTEYLKRSSNPRGSSAVPMPDRYSWLTAEYREFIVDNPVVLERGSLVGRVGLDRRATQITDVLADPDYGQTEAQRGAGFRALMGVPMLPGRQGVRGV